MKNIEDKLSEAIWVAKSLFDRGKTSGTSANLSFRDEDLIYITATNTCFGSLEKKDFAILDLDGNQISEIRPSKEYPLHLELYKKSEVGAVIHTHSFYSTIWSCLEHKNEEDCMPEYTPYLKMRLGTVGLIPYEKPGSEALFKAFRDRVDKSDGYILKNHGPVVGGSDIMAAFSSIEELEESAKIAWEFRDINVAGLNP